MRNVLFKQSDTQPTQSLFKLAMESVETAATSVFGLLISIPMLAITAHWLGPDGRGVFVTAITWAALAGTCSGFSLGFVAIHEMGRSGNKDVGPLVGTLLTLAAAESLVGWTAIAVLYHVDRGLFGSIGIEALFLGFFGVPFVIARDYLGAVLTGQSRISVYNRAQVGGNLLAFVLVAALALVRMLTVEAVILAWLLGQAAICVASFRDIRKRSPEFGISKDLLRSLLSGGYKLHLNAIGAMLISSIDVLMVNSFVGTHEVGYYQLATKLVSNVALLAQAVGAVMYGRIVESGPDATWSFVRRICVITVALVSGGALIAGLLAPYVIDILAGRLFAPSVSLFRLMLIAVPGLSLSYLMAPQWICRGYFWQAGGLTVVTAGGNILGNWLLVPRYGAYGAACCFVGVFLFSVLGNGGMFVFCELRWRRLREIAETREVESCETVVEQATMARQG